MTKKVKGISTILLMAVMLLSLLPTMIFAADDDPVDTLPPETGNLVVHKYLLDDLDDAGDPNNGHVVTDLPEDATALEDITFNAYLVTIGSDGVYPGEGPYVLDNYKNPTKMTDADGKEFAVTAASPASATTDEDGEATFANLTKGVYLVVEQDSELVANPVDPFVVAVPMTNSDYPDEAGSTPWLDTVHVYPKNEDMSIEKEANIDMISIGDIIEYTITPSVPSNIKDALKYDVTDVLDEALTYVANSLSVKGAATKAGAATGTEIPEEYYIFTYDVESNTLKVSFTEEGREYLGEEGYKFLAVSFETRVNAKLLDKDVLTIENDANVEFTNSYDQTIDRGTSGGGEEGGGGTVEVFTSAINITKTDSKNSETLLAGAEFKIATSAANAAAGTFLRLDAEGFILNVGDEGYATATDWVVTTSATGTASFKGIKGYIVDEDDEDEIEYLKYWIVETKAPAGYNLLSAPIEVDFDDVGGTGAISAEITVKNNKGFTLPQTGGRGTILFTVGGILLVGLAVILMMTSRKKATAKK